MSYGETSVAAYSGEATRAFFNKLYMWMCLGLVTTALVAVVTATTPALAKAVLETEYAFLGLILAELGLVVVLSAFINRFSSAVAAGIFVLYAALNGLTMSIILLAFTAESVALTFFVTAGTFGVMSLVGFMTRIDLSGLGGFLMMALIGLILGSVANLFLASTALGWLLTYAGILIFVGLTAYDTQKLKAMAHVGVETEEGRKGAVLGALTLYLDFINLFLLLLRIFGRRR